MSILFGNFQCNHCGLESRFLVEVEDQQTKTLLLGDESEAVKPVYKTDCDYCIKENSLYIIKKENIISAFLNQQQYIDYAKGNLPIKKASSGTGIKVEKKGLKQFHQIYSLSFDMQPFQIDEMVNLGKVEWKVQKVYRKEWVETDANKRMDAPMAEEYWYEVINTNGEQKWLIVTEEEENNAFLQFEHPILRDESERKVDISDDPKKPELILDCEWTNNMYVEAYEYKSGIRLIVINEQNEIELDLMRSSIEEAIRELEEYMELGIE